MSEKTVTIRVSADDSDILAKLEEMGLAAQTTADKITDSFGVGFKTKLDAAFKALPNIDIKADSSDVDVKVAEIKTALDTLRNQKIGVDVSDDEALAKIAELKAALISIGSSDASPRIRLDTSQAATALDDLETKLLGLGSGAGEAGGVASQGLSQLAQDGQGVAGALGPLGSFIIPTLATALIPLGGLAGGALATLPAILSGAGIGGAAIALGFGEMSTVIKGALSPALDDLKNKVDVAIGPDAFKIAFDLLTVLQDLSPFILAAAKDIADLGVKFASFLSSKQGLSDLNALVKEGGGFMKSLGDDAFNLFKTIMNAAPQAGPFLKTIGDDIKKAVDAADKWISGGGFEKFLNWLQQNGPGLITDVKNIAQEAGKLIVALTPVGERVLTIANAFASLLKNPVVQFLIDIVTHFNAMSIVLDVIKTAVSLFKTLWDETWPDIKKTAEDVWNDLVTDVFDPIGNFFTKDIPGALNVLKQDWDQVWGDIKSFAKTVWDDIWSAINTAVNAVRTTVDTVVDNLKKDWDTVWGDIKTGAKTVWDDIWGFVNTGVNAVRNTIDTVVDNLKQDWDTVWGAIKTGAKTIWDDIWGFANTGINAVRNTIDTVVGWITTGWGAAWNGLAGGFDLIWGTIKASAVAGVNGVIDIINGIITGVDFVLGVVGLHINTIDHIGGGPDISLGTVTNPTFHAGGLVGAPGIPTTGGPLASGERIIKAHVGEEVLTANDPRHANNLGGGFINNTGNFGIGGIIGGALSFAGSVASDAWSAISNLPDDALKALGSAVAATAIPGIEAGEGLVRGATGGMGWLGTGINDLTAYMGNALISWLSNLGGAANAKVSADAAAKAAARGGGGPIGTQATGDLLSMFTQILQNIGAPVNSTTLGDLSAWQAQEGGWFGDPDLFNPFNTTQSEPGSVGTNSVGVQSYPTFAAGLGATVQTLNNGNYGGILSALRSSAPLGAFEAAVSASPWGTVFDSGGVLHPGVTMAVNNTGHDEYVSTGRSGGAVYAPSFYVTGGATEAQVRAIANEGWDRFNRLMAAR